MDGPGTVRASQAPRPRIRGFINGQRWAEGRSRAWQNRARLSEFRWIFADALKHFPAQSNIVASETRLEKKYREAARLRDVPPETTIRMGFAMMRFGRKLHEAGRPGRH